MPMIPIAQIPAGACRGLAAVFSDIDDTLTRGGKIPLAVLTAIERLRATGLRFGLVTGRPAGFAVTLSNYFGLFDCVIAENGGVLAVDGAVRPLFPGLGSPESLAAVERAVGEILQRFPEIRVDPSNFMRLTDRAFRLEGMASERVREVCDAAESLGVSAVASSIQVHLFRGTHTKGAAIAAALAERFPGVASDQVLTIGDSANDAPMFDPARFPLSAGVANVHRFAGEMAHRPRFIASREGADGAVEILETLLARRTP